MLKALALENVWAPFFTSSKHRVAKKESTTSLRVWLAVGLIAANAALLMSYIYGVNEFASQGYQIKTLQTRLAALTEDNNKINLKVSEATSMVAIQSDFLNANFVAAGTPRFLQVSGNKLTER